MAKHEYQDDDPEMKSRPQADASAGLPMFHKDGLPSEREAAHAAKRRHENLRAAVGRMLVGAANGVTKHDVDASLGTVDAQSSRALHSLMRTGHATRDGAARRRGGTGRLAAVYIATDKGRVEFGP